MVDSKVGTKVVVTDVEMALKMVVTTVGKMAVQTAVKRAAELVARMGLTMVPKKVVVKAATKVDLSAG